MTPAEARQKLGLSQQEMARAMNVHYMTWRKWERGERDPDSAAKRLIDVLVWMREQHPRILARCLSEI